MAEVWHHELLAAVVLSNRRNQCDLQQLARSKALEAEYLLAMWEDLKKLSCCLQLLSFPWQQGMQAARCYDM